MINKNTFVRIRKTLLQPKERSSNLPQDTQTVPYKMWVKGSLQQDSDLFDHVEVKTVTGRIEKGRLKEANPPYKHNYGDFVEELHTLRQIILNDMGDTNE